MKVGNSEGRTVFFDGEKLDFSIQCEIEAHILMLSVAPDGYIYIILPKDANSDAIISNRNSIKIHNLGQVKPPFGTEFIKLFAFKEKISNLSDFSKKDGIIDPTQEEFIKLLKYIKEHTDWSETTQQVVTMEPN